MHYTRRMHSSTLTPQSPELALEMRCFGLAWIKWIKVQSIWWLSFRKPVGKGLTFVCLYNAQHARFSVQRSSTPSLASLYSSCNSPISLPYVRGWNESRSLAWISIDVLMFFSYYFYENFLRGQAFIAAILNEYSSIDLAFINVAFLVFIIDHTHGFCGLLQNPDLVLAASRVVVRKCFCDCLELVISC